MSKRARLPYGSLFDACGKLRVMSLRVDGFVMVHPIGHVTAVIRALARSCVPIVMLSCSSSTSAPAPVATAQTLPLPNLDALAVASPQPSSAQTSALPEGQLGGHVAEPSTAASHAAAATARPAASSSASSGTHVSPAATSSVAAKPVTSAASGAVGTPAAAHSATTGTAAPAASSAATTSTHPPKRAGLLSPSLLGTGGAKGVSAEGTSAAHRRSVNAPSRPGAK